MYEKDFNAIFSKNLVHFLKLNDMTQAELAARLGVSTATTSNWCNGIKIPRMYKVDAMCRIFNCLRSDLIDEKKKTENNPISLQEEKKEHELLEVYRKLSDENKDKTVQYSKGLLSVQEMDSELLLNAAHARTDIDIPEDVDTSDNDIMDDENF